MFLNEFLLKASQPGAAAAMHKSVYDFFLSVIISANIKRMQLLQGCSLRKGKGVLRVAPDFDPVNFGILESQLVSLSEAADEQTFKQRLVSFGMV